VLQRQRRNFRGLIATQCFNHYSLKGSAFVCILLLKMRVFLPAIAEGGPLELREVQAGASDARHNGLPMGGARLDDEGEITTFSTTAATFAT
jgi:hypothetical protein